MIQTPHTFVSFAPKDFGYTVYSRLEEAFRTWLRRRLVELFGDDWQPHIPGGVWTNARENAASSLW